MELVLFVVLNLYKFEFFGVVFVIVSVYECFVLVKVICLFMLIGILFFNYLICGLGVFFFNLIDSLIFFFFLVIMSVVLVFEINFGVISIFFISKLF